MTADDRRRAAVVFAVTAAASIPSLFTSLQWDDLPLLTRQAAFLAPPADALAFFWTNTALGHYTPVTWLSWALDHWIWGGLPWGFHLTNVFLHGLNAVLAAALMHRVLRIAAPAADSTDLAVGAAAGALFFSLHPLRAEVVAWATERRGLLSAFFGMAAALCHERALEGRARPWVAPALLAAAVLSKETAVMWPPVLVCWRWMTGRRDAEELRALAVLWVVGLAGGLAGFLAVHHQNISASWTDYGPQARLAQALRCPGWAALKTLWPSGLSPLYELKNPAILPLGRWLEAAAGGGLTLAALFTLKRKVSLSWGWIVQGLFLLPTCGVFQSGPQDTADRYTYLAGLPWAAAFGFLWVRVLPAARENRSAAMAALAALALWIGGLAGLFVRQQGFWRTPLTLWERAVSVSPDSPTAHYTLGIERGRAGMFEASLDSFQRALALDPAFARALYGAAVVSKRLGHEERAAHYLRLAVALAPEDEMVRRPLP